MATFVSSSVFAKIPKKSKPSNEQAQKEAEKEKLREEYRRKLEAEKQKAKQEAERKIEEAKQRQRMILEARKQAEIAKWIWKSRIGLREKLKQEKTQAKEKLKAQLEKGKKIKRREFERKLSLQAYRLLRAGLKRPQVEAWKQRQRAKFQQELQAWEQKQKSRFQQQITIGKKEAIQQFETKLQKKLAEVEQKLTKQIESALSAWEESAKQQLEFSIEEWEKQVWQKFETELLPKLKEIKQPKTWTEQFAEWYKSAPIPGRMLKKALGDIFGVPKPVRQITERSPVSPSIIGDIASFESFIKGIAHIAVELTPPRLPTPKSLGELFKPSPLRLTEIRIKHPEIFVKHRKWQIKMHKLIGPSPPTLSGVAFSYALSPILGTEAAEAELKRLMEWEKRYPGYIGGTVSGDVLISLLLGEAAGRIYRRIRGAKVKRLVYAEEVETLTAYPEKGKVEAITKTKPYVRYERVSLQAAKEIDEVLKRFQPEEILMAGEQKVYKFDISAKEYAVEILSHEAKRRAEPYIQAIMGKQTFVSKFDFKSPFEKAWRISIYSPEEMTKTKWLLEKIKSLFITKQPSSRIVTKTLIQTPKIKGKYVSPISQYSFRYYTGFQITGKMTPEAYAKVSKALPSAFRQTMGGITTEQLTKQLITSPKMIKVATDIVGIEYPSAFLPKLLGISPLALKAPIRKEIRKPTVTPSIKQFKFNIPTVKDIAKQFEKASEKVVSEIKLSQSLKLEQLTTQTLTEQISIPKFKIPSEPFKIKSKRKKGKLSPLLYGWGWMFSPVMEPKELMKLMFGGKRKK